MAKILLTAERCLMSSYHGALFLGFTACAPKSLFKPSLFFKFICPSVLAKNGIAELAPYGTRKIEAALLDHFKEDEVAVVAPDKIEKFITQETKIVGITSNDPLGLGPASTTFSGPKGLIKEESYNAWKFRELATKLRKYNVKIVVGGAGAWQLEDESIRRKLGVDVVVIGEGEKAVPELFERMVKGEKVPEVVYGEIVEPYEMPIIRGATIGGIVEIARGCGRSCTFCLPTMRRLRSRPLEHVLKEVQVNVNAGNRFITFHAEDVLRYKADGIRVNRSAVIELFESTMKIAEGAGFSHFALTSVASSPETVAEISNIVGIPSKEHPWLAGQTGVETGSPKIIREYMPGKARPFKPEEWPDVVEQAFGICKDNSWIPCGTLIIGFPKETEDDIIKTIELMDRLKQHKSLIVPLFFVPIGGMKGQKGFSAEEMKAYHWQLMLSCWSHNMRWLKPLAEEYLAKMPLMSRKFVMKFVEWVINKANSKVVEYIAERVAGKADVCDSL
ncbi:MAG: B12-binding domain-containing radical SAM protein [Methermicoccaceae archaeon]